MIFLAGIKEERKERNETIRKLFKSNNIMNFMEDTLSIRKSALVDLIKLREEFNDIIESLELADNKEFMDSYKKSKEQVKKREFTDWNAL